MFQEISNYTFCVISEAVYDYSIEPSLRWTVKKQNARSFKVAHFFSQKLCKSYNAKRFVAMKSPRLVYVVQILMVHK